MPVFHMLYVCIVTITMICCFLYPITTDSDSDEEDPFISQLAPMSEPKEYIPPESLVEKAALSRGLLQVTESDYQVPLLDSEPSVIDSEPSDLESEPSVIDSEQSIIVSEQKLEDIQVTDLENESKADENLSKPDEEVETVDLENIESKSPDNEQQMFDVVEDSDSFRDILTKSLLAASVEESEQISSHETLKMRTDSDDDFAQVLNDMKRGNNSFLSTIRLPQDDLDTSVTLIQTKSGNIGSSVFIVYNSVMVLLVF